MDALGEGLGLHPRSARDFLDALVALGFLTRKADQYSNTPETDAYLDPAKPSYMGCLLELANSRLHPFWSHLTEGLRTGLPQVAPTFKDYVSSHGLASRLRLEPGDCFGQEFPKADVALIGHILHD